MKKKSLFVTGALALSLLAAPTSSLAADGDKYSYKVDINQGQIHHVFNWLSKNEEVLKNGSFDVQSFLKQFHVQKPEPAPMEVPKQEQPEQETVEQEQPKQEAPSEPEPAPEVEAPAPDQPDVQAPEQEQKEEVSSDVSAFEKEVVELTNVEREKQGLAPLKLDTELSAVAKDKSLDMQNNGYFSHTSPTYGSPFDMMESYGIDYRTAGENIAMGQTSPEQVVNGWMNSEGHRENIMNPNFTHIGVGHAEGGNYWTQMFIGK
ncbi:hypothetical protein H0266_15350 [Halobacillus locisalis]|uniref:SCP domain-containing protein n=1 Tax=Halobacillus locisalis TaxID=220753 RepID=A0A838CWI0_9BACI|nr:CAP domain-containing protein [Halobacillus locisalis]MBA2176273.1 hypothetical protein [Halobacillus locisalis]